MQQAFSVKPKSRPYLMIRRTTRHGAILHFAEFFFLKTRSRNKTAAESEREDKGKPDATK
jgi:hypothetical protein